MFDRAKHQRIERFISRLRDTHPTFTHIYTQGGCFHFYEIMRELWPESEAWYDWNAGGHVLVRIDGRFYDITGLHVKVHPDVSPLDPNSKAKAHRWKRTIRLSDHPSVQSEPEMVLVT